MSNFSFLPQCFQKLSAAWASKFVYMWERVKNISVNVLIMWIMTITVRLFLRIFSALQNILLSIHTYTCITQIFFTLFLILTYNYFAWCSRQHWEKRRNWLSSFLIIFYCNIFQYNWSFNCLSRNKNIFKAEGKYYTR